MTSGDQHQRSRPSVTGRFEFAIEEPGNSSTEVRVSLHTERFPLANELTFWSMYPQEPDAFRAFVATKGIWVSVVLDRAVEKAVAEHLASDISSTETDIVANLPKPPTGYFWASDIGGLIRAGTRTFRLWNYGLGYMPKSE